MMKYLFYSKDGSTQNCFMDILVGEKHYYLTRCGRFYPFKLPGEAGRMKIIVEKVSIGVDQQEYYPGLVIAYMRSEQ